MNGRKVNILKIGSSIIENRFIKSPPRQKLTQENSWHERYFALIKLRENWASDYGLDTKLRASKGNIKLKTARTSLYLAYWGNAVDRFKNVKPIQIFPLYETNVPNKREHPYWPINYPHVFALDIKERRLFLCAESETILNDWISKISEHLGKSRQSFSSFDWDNPIESDTSSTGNGSSGNNSFSDDNSNEKSSRRNSNISLTTEILAHLQKRFSLTNLPSDLTIKTSDNNSNSAADEEIPFVDKITENKNGYDVIPPVVGCEDEKIKESEMSVTSKRLKYKKQKKLMLQRSVSLDYIPMGKDIVKELHDGYCSEDSNCIHLNGDKNQFSYEKSFKVFKSISIRTNSFLEKRYEFKRRPCFSKIKRVKENRGKSFDIQRPKDFFYQKKYTSLTASKSNYARNIETLQIKNSFDKNSHDSAQKMNRTNGVEALNLPRENLDLPANRTFQSSEPGSLSSKINEHTIRDSHNTLEIGDIVISFPSNSQLLISPNKVLQLKTAEVAFYCSFDYTANT